MLESQRIDVRRSEIRERLHELQGVSELDAEQSGEMDSLATELRGLEVRYRAAVTLEASEAEQAEFDDSPTDPEREEWAEVVGKASLSGLVEARARHLPTSGAEAELQQELGLQSDQIPSIMLADPVQERALTQTGDTAKNQRPTRAYTWPTATSAFANVQRVSVPAGSAVFPVVSSPVAIPGVTAAGTAVTEQNATITYTGLTPQRIQVWTGYQREQALTTPSLDADLRSHLSGAITTALDNHALNAASNGLAVQGTDPTAVGGSSAFTFANVTTAVAALIDGQYADSLAAIRLLIAPDTAEALITTTFATANPTNAYDWLAERLGGIRVSSLLPDSDSGKVDDAVAILGGEMNAVQPIWDNATIEDVYTDAAKGEVRIHVMAFTNFAVLKTAALPRMRFRTAA